VVDRNYRILQPPEFIVIMIRKFLFSFLFLLAGLESSLVTASEVDAANLRADPVVSQPMRIWEKISTLRRMSDNGIIPELDARGLMHGYSEETKMKIFREIGISEEFKYIQAEKLNDAMALLQCLRGHPIEKATINPECAKDGRVDRLIVHAEKLLGREDQIIRDTAEKYR
jgi:hypothetical protein